MVSQCLVPNNWNVRPPQQRQEEVVLLAVEGDDHQQRNRSSHVHSSTDHQNQNQNLTYVVPMPNYEVTTELTWENGQLGLHGLGGMVPTPSAQTKAQLQTWTTSTNANNKPVDTLESIVHQATSANHLPQYNHHHHHHQWGENSNSSSHMQMEHQQQINQHNINPSSTLMEGKWRENNGNNCGGKWRENNSDGDKKLMMSSMASSSGNKRIRSESNYDNNCGRKSNFDQMEDQSACASASATFCRDNDTTMMTWPSFESPRSMKTAPNADNDDSAYQDCSENQEGERMTKGESFRSQSSTRRSRAATVHNQSERRRRDRINEKMKALQKLVPNASKTDKASMLDEVIEYLKQLQSQVHIMNNARNMPQMVMPSHQLGMQHQIQMSLLARMGMGMGMGMDMGMLDVARNHMPQSFPHQLIHATAPLGGTATSFVPPPFTMAPLKANVNGASVPNFNDAYNTYIAQQSMNMDFLNKMSALYRQQQTNQAQQMTSKKAANSSMPNHGQGD